MTRVLITGGTGMIGRELAVALQNANMSVRAAVRRGDASLSPGVEGVVVGDISSRTDWGAALEEVDMVVHAAARTHVLHDAADNEDLYLETNARGTLRLAQAAAAAGVRRFLYISSIKVNGERTSDRPYSALDPPQPTDAYGRSKWLGEQYLHECCAGARMRAAIVRPPLVYGAGVKANFLRLLGWVHAGRPLPLGSIDNARSLISSWNLCDLLVRLLNHEGAAGKTWLAADGEDVSTPQLIREIAAAMTRPARLVRVPVVLLQAAGMLTGRRGEIARLCGSLVVDADPARDELGWRPPLSLREGIARTVEWYLRDERA